MCHEILKEEDDEVASFDEDKAADLLDDKNGNNISAKLTSLTLNDNDNDNDIDNDNDNDNDESVAGLNGSTMINESDRINATKSKKKAKKGGNTKIPTGIECDSNDNKIDEESNAIALESNNDRLTPSSDIIKDDVVNVQA